MENTVSETVKILVTESDAFKDFDFVVAAFGETVGNRRRKGIKNTGHPINHSLSAFFETLNPTVISAINPIGQSGFGRFSVFAIKDF